MKLIVADACSLILLAKVMLLQQTLEIIEIVITPEVNEECTKDLRFPDAVLLEEYITQHKIKVMEVRNKGNEMIRLGKGELSVIQLYKEQKAYALLTDDGKTIKYCNIKGYQYTTTPRVLLSLYKKNKIKKNEALVALKKLETAGRYAKDVIASIMLQLGE